MEYCYHYTSRYYAQSILADGVIKPRGRDGVVYLAGQLYTSGAEVSDRLGISDKPIEICFAIPRTKILGLSAPSEAAAKGNRRGKGEEYKTTVGINVVDIVAIVPVRVP